MNRHFQRIIFKLMAVPGLACSVLVCAAQTADTAPAMVSQTRQAELVHLVRQDCGSCHGLTLNGGLGPALLPETLKGKPPEYLKAAILHGLAPSAMPPWKRFLSETDAEWIVINLQKGFPSGY
jgi:cytochrome c55X